MIPLSRRLCVIDINVLGFSAMWQRAYMDMSFEGRPTGAIQGTLDKILALADDRPDHVPVVLWDDRCHWREQILPAYKRHRWETPEQRAMLESYLAQAEVVRELLCHLGIAQVFCPGFEADDLAGVIARNCDPGWEIVLATSDTDWLQALRPNVVWISPATGQRVTVDDLGDPEKVKGGPFASTEHYIRAKALAGDTSDGIPGVEGVGLKTAARIIREHGSIEALWARHDAGVPIKGAVLQRTAGRAHREMYYRNLRLVDWRLAPALSADYDLRANAPDPEAFRALCATWGLTRRKSAAGGAAAGRADGATIAAIGEMLAKAAGPGKAIE